MTEKPTEGEATPARDALPKPIREPGRALEENVRAISAWEQSALHSRSRAQRLGDRITAAVASGPVLFGHVLWFATWIGINLGVAPGLAPFDPFPFPLLTTMVSLEAIFLALFVLASQNRFSVQADKRAHLNLQVDLLAEREMTVVLQLLMDIKTHLGVADTVTAEQLRDLVTKTDIHELTAKLEKMPNATAEQND